MNFTIPRSPELKRVTTCLTALATITGLALWSFVPSAMAATCGSLVLSGSSWAGGNGVDARSNGVYEGTGTSCGSFVTNLNANPPQFGEGWQCVELAQRMFNTHGWYSGTFNGVNYASQIYTTASQNGWTRMANGSISLSNIVPGDMLVTNEGTFGHVMLVDSINGNTINVVDQNAGDGGRDTVTFSSGSLSDGSYSFSGVVHSPNDSLGIGSAGGSFTPGITRADGSNLAWYLRNENSGGSADVLPVFDYGLTSDTPIVGDWDGDGTTTVGVVRKDGSGWHWYLRNSNSGGSANTDFIYGLSSTDIPVVGNWDGSGSNHTTTIGVVRRNGAGWEWLLRNTNNGGSANLDFAFGVYATDTPIVGDWDGNGTTTIGLYRQDGVGWHWYLRNANSAGSANADFLYGLNATDTPIPGDWDGDGDTNPGLIRPDGTGLHWYLRTVNSGGAATTDFIYGLSATDSGITGDWDDQ